MNLDSRPSTPSTVPPSLSTDESLPYPNRIYHKGLESENSSTQNGRVTRVAAKLLFDDLRRPHEWYPLARRMKRKIIMHVGPTNSGKTHSALEKLKLAKSGVYCAPLRLLAEQVFEKMNEDGVACNLVTGEKIIELDELGEEDRRILSEGGDEAMAMLYSTKKILRDEISDGVDSRGDDGDDIDSTSKVSETFGEISKKVGKSSSGPVRHVSCTVEMSDVRREVDVALIDEYQLISDESRGWAWTRALLGIPAREIHLCGDTSGIDLVKSLLLPTGDEVAVHHYDRLSPLVVSRRPLLRPLYSFHSSSSSAPKSRRNREKHHHLYNQHDWIRELRSGDAVIVFSRKAVFQHKKMIESALGTRVSVVYGSLPPETRSLQAKKFNRIEGDEQNSENSENADFDSPSNSHAEFDSEHDLHSKISSPSHMSSSSKVSLESKKSKSSFSSPTSSTQSSKSHSNSPSNVGIGSVNGVGDNKILVATDAIGLGLNLNIRRIIFSSLRKFDGIEMRDLRAPEVRQIGGRAGRFGSLYPAGEVTCIHSRGIPFIQYAFNEPVVPHTKAGLFPTFEHIELFENALSQYILNTQQQQSFGKVGVRKNTDSKRAIEDPLEAIGEALRTEKRSKRKIKISGSKRNNPLKSRGNKDSQFERSLLEHRILEEMKRRGRIPKDMKRSLSDQKNSSISSYTLSTSKFNHESSFESQMQFDEASKQDSKVRVNISIRHDPNDSNHIEPSHHHIKHGLLDEFSGDEDLLSDPHLFSPRHLPSHHRHHPIQRNGNSSFKSSSGNMPTDSISRPVSSKQEYSPSSSNSSSQSSLSTPSSETSPSSSSLPSINLGDILDVYEEIANLSGLFFLCRSDDHKKLARAIDHLPLSLREKYTFVLSPINSEDALLVKYLTRFATLFSKGYDIPCPTIASMAEMASKMERSRAHESAGSGYSGWEEEEAKLFQQLTLNHPSSSSSKTRLDSKKMIFGGSGCGNEEGQNVGRGFSSQFPLPIRRWEQLYKVVELYLWLSYRFEGFVEIEEALYAKLEIETQIAALLDFMPTPSISKPSYSRKRQRMLMSAYGEEEENSWMMREGGDFDDSLNRKLGAHSSIKKRNKRRGGSSYLESAVGGSKFSRKKRSSGIGSGFEQEDSLWNGTRMRKKKGGSTKLSSATSSSSSSSTTTTPPFFRNYYEDEKVNDIRETSSLMTALNGKKKTLKSKRSVGLGGRSGSGGGRGSRSFHQTPSDSL